MIRVCNCFQACQVFSPVIELNSSSIALETSIGKMKAHFLPSSVYCILLCSISLPIALTTIIPPRPLGSLLIHSNLTDNGVPRCAYTSEWTSNVHAVNKKDCYGAIDRMRGHAQKYGHTKFEFFRDPDQRQTSLPHVGTPGCYGFGTCAVCLAMLTDFSPTLTHSIPRPPPEPWSKHEVADPETLWHTAQLIGDICVRGANAYGWAPAGAGQNLGVFLWAGGSELERDAGLPGVPGNNNISLSLPGDNNLGDTSLTS